ncbi:response regulator transcription factor [Streptomyces sp. NPDC002506]|uniref:response regulator transcription factor n=1 Tax=Streptomyces sp. NPDC002506 TaxID=3154536 RepID=UPI003324F3FF
MIKVVIVEDNVIARTGLQQILSSGGDVEVAATASDAASGLAAVLRTRPDVALVDFGLPDESGLSLATRLLALPEPPRVLILTAFHDGTLVREALTGGVSGFLLKDLSVEDLLEAVRAAHEGHAVLHPEVAGRLVASLRRADRPSPRELERLAALTDRERAVLRLLATGLTNAAVGRELGLTEAAVKNHVTHALTKLDLANRVQLARFVDRVGLAD